MCCKDGDERIIFTCLLLSKYIGDDLGMKRDKMVKGFSLK